MSEVPKEWELKNLGDISTIERGISWSKRNESKIKTSDSIPVLRIGNIQERHLDLNDVLFLTEVSDNQISKHKVSKNDILLVGSNGNRDLVGRSCKINKDTDFIYASFLMGIKKISHEIDPDYLLYYLNSPQGWNFIRNSTSTGVGINNLKISKLRETPIAFPKKIETQKNIVQKLDYILGQLEEKKKILLDIKNKNKKRINDLYEQIYGEIITKYFESQEVKNNSIYQQFEDVCILNPSKSELVNFDENMEVSFVPMKAVDSVEGIIKTPEIRHLTEVKKGYTYFRENDVIFAKITPCMENGKSAICKNLKNKLGFGSTEFHVLRPKDIVLSEWIYYFVRQNKFRKHAEKVMSGSAGQQRVPISFIQSYKIPIPSIKIQKKILEEIKNARKSVLQIQDNIQPLFNQLKNSDEYLHKLNNSILYKAFSGKLVP